MKKVYKGWLQKGGMGNDSLCLDTDDDTIKLIDEINSDKEYYGNYLSVSYYISDKEVPIDQIKEEWLKKVMGIAETDYGERYGTELTGYMWTDQQLNVGGHDLLAELESYLHKYLVLEIEYSKEPKK